MQGFAPAAYRSLMAKPIFKRLSLLLLVSLACLGLAAGPIRAQTVYKWVDAEGQITYSEHPPPASAERVETLERAPEVSAADVQAARERAQRLKQSAEELEAARLAREGERATQREHAREKAPIAPLQIIVDGDGDDAGYGYPGYPSWGWPPPTRPPHPPRPTPPTLPQLWPPPGVSVPPSMQTPGVRPPPR